MEYFVYCRDRAGSGDLRRAHVEEHWSFMDRYGDVMIARGPTLTPDGSAHTGSMHIVDLPDAEAARVFAHKEPYAKAGVFEDIMVWPWTNALQRTMWDFQGDETDPRFLAIGYGRASATRRRDELLAAHRDYLNAPGRIEHTILRGPLWDDSGEEWVGSAFLLEAPDMAFVEALFADEPYTKDGLYERLDIHRWRFGGRRALLGAGTG